MVDGRVRASFRVRNSTDTAIEVSVIALWSRRQEALETGHVQPRLGVSGERQDVAPHTRVMPKGQPQVTADGPRLTAGIVRVDLDQEMLTDHAQGVCSNGSRWTGVCRPVTQGAIDHLVPIAKGLPRRLQLQSQVATWRRMAVSGRAR